LPARRQLLSHRQPRHTDGMSTFSIKVAGPDDLADIADLFRAYADALPVDLAAQGLCEELAGLPGVYGPPRGALLIAWPPSGRSAVGCIALRALGAHSGEVKRLYVRPSA